MKEAQKGVRMTDEKQSGFIEAHPAPSKQVLRPSDAGLSNVDRMAESIAREIGYSGTAYAMEVVHIQDRVFEMAKRGEILLYREDKPFPFLFGGLYDVHGGLRLGSADVHKVRAEFIGTTSAEPSRSSARANASHTAFLVPLKSHRIGRDLISPAIEDAQSKCADPFDVPAVFNELSAMAEAKVRPLYGIVEEGIQWTNDKDEPQILKRKNLSDRLARAKKKALLTS